MALAQIQLQESVLVYSELGVIAPSCLCPRGEGKQRVRLAEPPHVSFLLWTFAPGAGRALAGMVDPTLL